MLGSMDDIIPLVYRVQTHTCKDVHTTHTRTFPFNPVSGKWKSDLGAVTGELGPVPYGEHGWMDEMAGSRVEERSYTSIFSALSLLPPRHY